LEDHKKHTSLRHRLHEIIYEADTPSGKLFDVVLLIAILVSVLFVMLESIDTVADEYGELLNISEWIITILFSIEYILRIVSIKKPWKYIFSFYGIIDFLSTIPKYIAFFVVGSHNLAALRALRLLRVFRILKLTRYIGESNRLVIALKNSRVKISVFLFFVLIICIILGTVMYMIEGEYNDDFTSAPRGVYWAIVTLTTVGYGDIHPITVGGQFIASIVMIMGYAIIAIPTGIVSSEMFRAKVHVNTQACPHCLAEEHPDGAIYCYNCGEKLNE
jgi:voltage-gated potassium channel